jgi:pyruvate/2-oxoacid:ferredoxin oxidoreductase beta subunit
MPVHIIPDSHSADNDDACHEIGALYTIKILVFAYDETINEETCTALIHSHGCSKAVTSRKCRFFIESVPYII